MRGLQRLRAGIGEITMNYELLLDRAIGWRLASFGAAEAE